MKTPTLSAVFLLCIWVLASYACGATESSAGAAKVGFDSEGRVRTLSVGAKDFTLKRGVPVSGFSLADHAKDKLFKPLKCRLKKSGKAIAFGWSEDGLSLDAKMLPVKNGWEIKGSISRSGPERFVSIRFGLPIDVQNWTYWDDFIRMRQMSGTSTYTSASPSSTGSGYQDFLPVTCISEKKGAVAFAVRFDEQWFHHTGYAGETGLFYYVQDIALVDGQQNYSKSVPFHFYILTPGGQWGLRAVTESYFDLFKQWRGESKDRRKPEYRAGGWIAWGDAAVHVAPLSDFGLLYHEQPDINGFRTCDALGYYGLPYIEPTMYQQYHGEMTSIPNYDQAYQRLEDNSKVLKAKEQEPVAYDKAWIHGISKGTLKSTIIDSSGRPIDPIVGNWPWIGGSNYGAQFPLNLEPNVPGGVGQYRLGECKKLLQEPYSDGIYLDSYCSHFSLVDYSRANVNASLVPPTFGSNLLPCVTVWSGLSTWVQELRRILPDNKRCVLPNIYTIAGPVSWQCMDILGKENWSEPTGGLMARLRQMGYHKVLTQLPSYEAQSYKFLKQLLLFDVVPGGYGGSVNDPPEASRADYAKLLPVFRILHELMWQPITLATSSNNDILIERYGNAPGPVMFVITNIGDPARSEVTLDLAAVPGGREAWLVDPLNENPLSWRWEKGKLAVTLALENDQTAVFAVGSTMAQRIFKQMWSQDRLSDIQSCFKEFQYRNGRAHPQAALARTLKTPESLEALAVAIKAEDPVSKRIVELLKEAQISMQQSLHPVPTKPAVVAEITKTIPVKVLPFVEEFDDPLDPEKWSVDRNSSRIDVSEGKLIMELKDSANASIASKDKFDFRTQPVVLETRFINRQQPDEWYLGTFITLQGHGDYLMLRIDDGKQIRLENWATAASNYTIPVFHYRPLQPNAWHDLKFTVDSTRYRLQIDGNLISEGNHGAMIAQATANLIMSSGHLGHGYTWEIEYLKISRGAW